MKGFFVTGTDTGVGKTYVTCSLAKRAKGRVFAFKPIETGCDPVEGRLVGADQQLVTKAAGDWQTGELCGVYQFKNPVAPLVASAKEGIAIDLDRIVRVMCEGAAQADLTLVEGAGGWRVPITPTEDMGTLAKRIGLPVLVVARAGLGTINHSLLTIEAIEKEGLRCAAVILSRRPDESLDFARSNAEQIRNARHGASRVFLLEDIADLAMLD